MQKNNLKGEIIERRKKDAIPKKKKSAAGRVVLSSFTNIYFRIFLLLLKLKLQKMIRDFFYGLGDIFESLWTIMPSIGNIPNDISILVVSAFLFTDCKTNSV